MIGIYNCKTNLCLLSLIHACAPAADPHIIERIIRVESNNNPFAVNINGAHLDYKPKNLQSAVNLAYFYIKRGYSVDLGLMQINSKNLFKLGYGVQDIFNPCLNIAVGANVLAENYRRAIKHFKNKQMALRGALSAYNTGNFTAGYKNAYIMKYYLDDYNHR